MQAFTIFFGLAIVAIAIENFAAKFVFGKTSDAGAKGHRDIQSRVGNGQKYWLRGNTGTETVIIRDGKNIKPHALKTTDQEFTTTNSKITIEFTNDECCGPDRNVIFTPDYPIKISTKDNDFPTNYLEKWNCGNCSMSSRTKISKSMVLQSRDAKVDRCWITQKDDVQDCDKCGVVKDGQFCYPGNYTIYFLTEGQCKDVTFGGCNIPKTKFEDFDSSLKTDRKCAKFCEDAGSCNSFRFDRQSKNCTIYKAKYRGEDCNIRAGPMDKSVTECLFTDHEHPCDTLLDEECEYHGFVVKRFRKGDINGPEPCYDQCKLREPDCKYWIYRNTEAECILRRDGNKTCNVLSGKKMTLNDFDKCLKAKDN